MSSWRRNEKKEGEKPEDWERDGESDPFDDPFFGMRDDMFRDMDGEMRRMRAYMNAVMDRAVRGELGQGQAGGPYVYGWSMKVGPDGVPHVQTFGNVKPGAMSGRRTALAGGEPPEEALDAESTEEGCGCQPDPLAGPGVREPLTDVCDAGTNLVVTAEMPGIEREDIELETVDDTLVIRVEKGHRKYYKEVELPSSVVPNSARAKYNNGVLDITLEKAPAPKKVGTRINVD
jgi:HSP20 family protein